MTEKKTYKHKLNMLGPGSIMSKAVTVLFAVAVALYFAGQKVWAYIAGGISVVLLFILLILLAVEQHQDRVLCMQQKKEDEENGIR